MILPQYLNHVAVSGEVSVSIVDTRDELLVESEELELVVESDTQELLIEITSE